MARSEITDVFTPRHPTVNSSMYVERKQLETALIRSIKGSMHSFLFGESGNGKSWLYKKAFNDKKVTYVVANCANASIKDSVIEEIYSVCQEAGKSIKTGYTETKKAELLGAGLAHEGDYEIIQEDKLLTSFKKLHQKANKKRAVIVLDNVETIFDNEKLMGELSDVIILLDDARYAQYNVKFLLVGVPHEVMQYFSSAKNSSSVANRIEELYRVAGLDYPQVRLFVRKGLEEFLDVLMTKEQAKVLSRHIFDITLGVPQRIHEYCSSLAYEIEDNGWIYEENLIDVADHRWLTKGLRGCYTIIDSHLNSDETSDGRRNQVIYSLARITTHQLDTTGVGGIISEEFPNTAPESNSGIGQVLANLSKGENPILKRISNSGGYVVTDPRHLMCIKVMLYKDVVTEKVRKKRFNVS